jgi:hypothetical protein
MSLDRALLTLHPAGEPLPVEALAVSGPQTLDTFAGPVRVEWAPSSPLTPLGQVVYFAEFLKVSGRFDATVDDCPLSFTSPNAPEVRAVVGTWVLSALAGHRRYAHVTALRSDQVLPELLGMAKIVSEDSLRRALVAMPEQAGLDWLQRHIDQCTFPLLGERYIIDPRLREGRHRHHGEATIRAPGRCGGQLQSEEAGAAEPCASYLHSGRIAPRPGRGDRAWLRIPVMTTTHSDAWRPPVERTRSGGSPCR